MEERFLKYYFAYISNIFCACLDSFAGMDRFGCTEWFLFVAYLLSCGVFCWRDMLPKVFLVNSLQYSNCMVSIYLYDESICFSLWLIERFAVCLQHVHEDSTSLIRQVWYLVLIDIQLIQVTLTKISRSECEPTVMMQGTTSLSVSRSHLYLVYLGSKSQGARVVLNFLF